MNKAGGTGRMPGSLEDVLAQAYRLARLASRWDVFDAVRDGVAPKAGRKKGDLALALRRGGRDLTKSLRGPLSVVTLRICHKHGEDTFLFASEEEAFAQVASFARQWWKNEVGRRRMPKDEKRVIRDYFEATGGEESYAIDREQIPEIRRSRVGVPR